MKRITNAAFFALLFLSSGCSDDDSPAAPEAPFAQYQLQEVYYLSQNGHKIPFVTSDQHLMIRFRAGTTEMEKNRVAEKYHLNFFGPVSNYFDLTATETDGAIARSALLTQEPVVEYVGPLFITGVCGEDLTWGCLTNTFIVHADQSDPQVVAALARAHATRIQDPFGAGPRDALYELPWENPAIQFELNAELTTIPAVDYAEPNFLYRICPLTPGMTQSH